MKGLFRCRHIVGLLHTVYSPNSTEIVEEPYTLEPDPDATDDRNAPPQKLSLAFSTADVVILGWRLGTLADKLRENELAAVRVLPERYGHLDRATPAVASITITPVTKA